VEWIKWVYLTALLLIGPAMGETFINIATEEWRPFSYIGPDGEVTGQSTDKVRAVFKLAGLNYKISSYPWARAYHLAVTQANTAVYTIKRTAQREDQFQWVCPIQPSTLHYFFSDIKRKDIAVNTIEDAKKFKVGVARNGFDQQYLLNNGFVENIDFDVASDDSVNLRKVLDGRLDLVMGTKTSIAQSMHKIGRHEDEVVIVWALETSALVINCLAFGLKTPKPIVDKLRHALKQLDSGENETPLILTPIPTP
jgi:polar amino acid transport system substrate-binding protein